ncbi:MAG: 4-hydroxy-3-methylbut-2-enyl diphosphate reductase [Hyphomicrobium sp.]
MSTAAPPDRSIRPPLTVYLAAPRGFCAGVDRAIQIVELALAKYGAPVYVRHEIVHNRFVVDSLKAKGAVFVEELGDIPETDQPVIFSAHGVAKAVPAAAKQRNMFVLDATCPLVFKVHNEAARHHEEGLEILLIGHAGHPEVVGTMGQLPEGVVTLIETAADAQAYEPRDAAKLAFVTQTTLSVDDTAAIVSALRSRFPLIVGPHKEDICYATTNRQAAVKAIAPKIGCLLVVGSPQSSNSLRLVEVAERAGCSLARLIEGAREIPWDELQGIEAVGVTAGASAPEKLVEEVIEAFRERYDVTIETVTTALERIAFNVPRELRPATSVS